MNVGPDPERWAEADQRAKERRKIIPDSPWDADHILALDVLHEYAEDLYEGPRSQVAWALRWAEHATHLIPHELAIRERAWQKIRDDADQAEWERLGLLNPPEPER